MSTAFRRFLNSETGPRTVHFWVCPLCHRKTLSNRLLLRMETIKLMRKKKILTIDVYSIFLFAFNAICFTYD